MQRGGGGGDQPRDDIMIMVPNSAVGALIGAGGSHIKQVIRDSNAYVTVCINLMLYLMKI